MAISHFSQVFAVSDAKLSKLTADPSGGSPTYVTAIDIPGIKSMEISGDVEIKELRGDNQLLDKRTILKSLKASVSHAKISFDTLAVLIGATTTDSGTTPNQIADISLLGGSVLSQFKLEGKTPTGGVDTPTGDAHFVLHKCIVASFPPLGMAEEDYRTFGFDVEVVPLLSNNKWFNGLLNETAAAIT